MDYYIIGSKHRREDGWHDLLSDMVRQSVVEVGWGWEQKSLEHLYGQSNEVIVEALRKLGEPSGSYNTHKLFLNLRPGDWVAIKKDGSPKGTRASLVIHGYARVIEKHGKVYLRGREPLNHCLHAEFLEHGNEYTFPFGYGRTVHRLRNHDHIRRIFQPVGGGKEGPLPIADPARGRWHRKAAAIAEVEDHSRTTRSRTVAARRNHDRLRNRLCQELKAKYGVANVAMELDWIDIQVSHPDRLELFEVKPYHSVSHCIREALGQVLVYAWRQAEIEQRPISLIVAGPGQPDKADKDLIRYVRTNLNLDFDYRAVR